MSSQREEAIFKQRPHRLVVFLRPNITLEAFKQDSFTRYWFSKVYFHPDIDDLRSGERFCIGLVARKKTMSARVQIAAQRLFFKVCACKDPRQPDKYLELGFESHVISPIMVTQTDRKKASATARVNPNDQEKLKRMILANSFETLDHLKNAIRPTKQDNLLLELASDGKKYELMIQERLKIIAGTVGMADVKQEEFSFQPVYYNMVVTEDDLFQGVIDPSLVTDWFLHRDPFLEEMPDYCMSDSYFSKLTPRDLPRADTRTKMIKKPTKKLTKKKGVKRGQEESDGTLHSTYVRTQKTGDDTDDEYTSLNSFQGMSRSVKLSNKGQPEEDQEDLEEDQEEDQEEEPIKKKIKTHNSIDDYATFFCAALTENDYIPESLLGARTDAERLRQTIGLLAENTPTGLIKQSVESLSQAFSLPNLTTMLESWLKKKTTPSQNGLNNARFSDMTFKKERIFRSPYDPSIHPKFLYDSDHEENELYPALLRSDQEKHGAVRPDNAKSQLFDDETNKLSVFSALFSGKSSPQTATAEDEKGKRLHLFSLSHSQNFIKESENSIRRDLFASPHSQNFIRKSENSMCPEIVASPQSQEKGRYKHSDMNTDNLNEQITPAAKQTMASEVFDVPKESQSSEKEKLQVPEVSDVPKESQSSEKEKLQVPEVSDVPKESQSSEKEKLQVPEVSDFLNSKSHHVTPAKSRYVTNSGPGTSIEKLSNDDSGDVAEPEPEQLSKFFEKYPDLLTPSKGRTVSTRLQRLMFAEKLTREGALETLKQKNGKPEMQGKFLKIMESEMMCVFETELSQLYLLQAGRPGCNLDRSFDLSTTNLGSPIQRLEE